MNILLKSVTGTAMLLLSVGVAASIKTDKGYTDIDNMIKHQGKVKVLKLLAKLQNNLDGTLIDEFTIRAGVVLEGATLVNRVRFRDNFLLATHGIDIHNIKFINSYKEVVVSGACSNPAQRALLDNGIQLKQTFLDMQGYTFNSVLISKNSCK